MALTINVKLTSAGADTNNVELYTDSNGYTIPITTTTTEILTSPFGQTVSVPSNSTICRIQNTGSCTNYVDITITS